MLLVSVTTNDSYKSVVKSELRILFCRFVVFLATILRGRFLLLQVPVFRFFGTSSCVSPRPPPEETKLRRRRKREEEEKEGKEEEEEQEEEEQEEEENEGLIEVQYVKNTRFNFQRQEKVE